MMGRYIRKLIRAALIAALPARSEEDDTVESILKELRNAGWSVGVHNDYRLDGERRTFWLFTHRDGRWIKGEGFTDLHALQLCKTTAARITPAAVQEAER